MAFKFVVLCSLLAYVSASGLLAAPAIAYGAAPSLSYATPAITSQSSNILRSFGNLGQVSTYSKTIDTPFSSVRKHDVRVSNPGVRSYGIAPAIAAYSAPAVAAYSAPAVAAYSAPAIAAPVYRSALAAPVYRSALAAPVYRSALAAPAIAAPAAIGVAYSAAPAVSHISYTSAYANYGW